MRSGSQSPEERIQGRLRFWIQKQRLKAGREPTPAEIAARREELLAELTQIAGEIAGGGAAGTGARGTP